MRVTRISPYSRSVGFFLVFATFSNLAHQTENRQKKANERARRNLGWAMVFVLFGRAGEKVGGEQSHCRADECARDIGTLFPIVLGCFLVG